MCWNPADDDASSKRTSPVLYGVIIGWLQEAEYVINEANLKTYVFNVSSDRSLTDGKLFANEGREV